VTEPQHLVVVVDDDASVRKSLNRLFRSAGYNVQTYASGKDFLAVGATTTPTCAILDLAMPGLNGLELQERLLDEGAECGFVFLTGHGNLDAGIKAMKHGAVDFLLKPVDEARLLAAVEESLTEERQRLRVKLSIDDARRHFQALTPREREVMELVVAGRLNKLIAADLGISEKTVKAHRAHVMDKTGARSLAELVRLYIAARDEQSK
jgi:FixJ family two-component response regulator